jgi:hypothetical protein
MARQRKGGSRQSSRKPADIIPILADGIKKHLEKHGHEVQLQPDPISETSRGFTTQFTHFFNRLPHPNESAAIAAGLEKTAALFFDRVWAPGPFVIPLDDVRFSGTSKSELELCGRVFSTVEEVTGRPIQFNADGHPFNTNFPLNGHQLRDLFVRTVREPNCGFKLTVDEKPTEKPTVIIEPYSSLSALIASSIAQSSGVKATLVFASEALRDRNYKPGDLGAVIAVLTELELPLEDRLEWEQIGELRTDKNACNSIRQLRHWLDKDMVGKGTNYIADHIAISIDNYRSAIRKHGIVTGLSALSGTFSAIGVPTLLDHLAAQPWYMLLAEGLAIGGGITAKVFQQYLTKRLEMPDEISLVCELQKKMNSTSF